MLPKRQLLLIGRDKRIRLPYASPFMSTETKLTGHSWKFHSCQQESAETQRIFQLHYFVSPKTIVPFSLTGVTQMSQYNLTHVQSKRVLCLKISQ